MATDFSSGDIARKYAEGLIAEELTLRPLQHEVVGKCAGRTILDLGCGDGKYSLAFAEGGAKVIALDASEPQIALAKTRHPHPNVEYRHDSVAKLAFLKPHTIDIVFASMLIPDLDDPAVFGTMVSQLRTVLKLNGRFVFSNLHPLYIARDQDTTDHAVAFRAEQYFQIGSSYDAEATTTTGTVIHFHETHMTVGHISQTLRDNTFVIRQLFESGAVPEKGILLPKYLVFECVIQP